MAESGAMGEARQPTVQECEECGGTRDCGNFKVCANEGFFLKTVRDFNPGEIVFRELPLVVVPKIPVKDGFVPCVGCCRLISLDNASHCPECSWPTCTPDCEDLKIDSKHGLECQILKQKSKSELEEFRFEILLPLRVSLIPKINQTQWENLEKCFGNEEDLNLINNESVEFLEEENSKFYKILNHVKNCLEIQDHLQVFYPSTSLLIQNCTPNCFQTFDLETHQITVRANSAIPQNSPLTLSRSDLFKGTLERLSVLKTPCVCPRCLDPTEFGTYFSALKCLGSSKQPCNGNQLPSTPTDPQTLWLCDSCDLELPNNEMMKFVNHLGGEVTKVLAKNPSIEELEEFLAKLLMFLHPNHYYVCGVKHEMVKLYGEDSVGTKVEICEGLVEIARKFFPNGGVFWGELLHELFEGKFLVLRRKFEGGERGAVEEVRGLVEESKRNVEGMFEPKLRKIILSDEESFNEWCKKNSI